MSVYGFNRKETAEQAAALTRQLPPGDNVFPYQPSLGMSWVCKGPANGIPALSGTIPQKAPCQWFLINNDTGELVAAKNSDGTDLTVEVYNVGPNSIVPNEWFVPTLVGDKACIGGGTGAPATSVRVQYVILRKFTSEYDGRFIARALLVEGGTTYNPEDPDTPIVPGSELLIHDPHNHFPNPTFDDNITGELMTERWTGSIGWAYLRTPTTSANNPEDVIRWEVEQQTLPVRKMRVYLHDCLLWDSDEDDKVITARFNHTRGLQLGMWPNVDVPNEVREDPANGMVFAIDVKNPFKFTAVQQSNVWIELEDDTLLSRRDVDLPYSGGPDGGLRWNITAVEKPIARYIRVRKESGGWAAIKPQEFGIDYAEGYPANNDDSTCPPVVEGANTCANMGTIGWAFYKPENHEYEVFTTESALYGTPTPIDAVTGGSANGCKITLSKGSFAGWCFAPGDDEELDLATKTVRVATNIYASGGELCTTYLDVPVCSDPTGGGEDCIDLCNALDLVRATVVTGVSWGDSSNRSKICFTYGSVYVCAYDVSPTPQCVDICEILCECPQLYSLPEVCDPPPPPCTDECVYRWDTNLDPPDWVLDIDCPDPQDPDCQCPDKPTEDGVFDGDLVFYKCGEEPPPPDCDATCSDCGEDLTRSYELVLDSLVHTANAAGWGGGRGALISRAGCTLNYEMNWAEFFGGGEQKGTVSVEKNASQWTVTFTNAPQGVTPSYTYDRSGTPNPMECNIHVNDKSPDAPAGLPDGEDASMKVMSVCSVANTTSAVIDAVKVERKRPKLITASTPMKERRLANLVGGDPPAIEGIGDQMYNDNEKYFAGCGCKRDVIAVMNRWTIDMVTEENVQRVAKRIHTANKNKKYPINSIRWDIIQAARKWLGTDTGLTNDEE